MGLFCFENFKFDQDARHSMEEDFNIKFDDIEKINIKEDLIFTVKTSENTSETLHIPFDQLTNYMRPACRACYDFLNIYADISFGGLGSPDKYTTVITRTDKGKKIIADALNAGIIQKLEMDEDAKSDMINLITRFSSAKIERRDTFMSELQ
ncbi:MAG TPA: Coenzyme F420 hydrogenase/dehydrogenase, beta subunit C-terminal domain [Candidatus Lokiarchaeia archaeon]|nr:Coenzyme F420 hydrogenase/dehydrogenase, beta subunit C-terminal domain [Candidatus Lokiarchaeia archaeon]